MVAKSKPSDIFDARYPARRILKLIGDKWTPIVLYCLSGGVRRFNELQHHIPDISKKMLIQVLRKLEASGLVAPESLSRGAAKNGIHPHRGRAASA